METLLTLAGFVLTEGDALMRGANLEMRLYSAIALILILLAIKTVKKSSRLRSARAVYRPSGRRFESKRIQALKPCPHCAKELPLSAILCEACDYNFLAERPGRGQKLLPPPEPRTHELTEQELVSVGI